jgi:SAM-dependent methyltransferase
MEEPALLDELGTVTGLRVLDLGCGDAAIGPALLNAGCHGYLGLDGSVAMVEAGNRALHGMSGRVELIDIEDFSAPPSSFVLIVSRLAFHYVEDLAPVLAACRASLTPGGRIVFTVVHPVLTSYDPGVRGPRKLDRGRLFRSRGAGTELAGWHRHVVSPHYRGLRGCFGELWIRSDVAA